MLQEFLKDFNEFKVEVRNMFSVITDSLAALASQNARLFEMLKEKMTANSTPLGCFQKSHGPHQHDSSHNIPPSYRDDGTINVGATIPANFGGSSSHVKDIVKVIMRTKLN